MEELKLLREDLAQCDEILLNTLIMRNRIVEQIMAYKEKNGLAIIQPDQEKKQAEHMTRALEGVPHQKEIRDIFNAVYLNSKRIQARKLFDYNILLIGFMGAGKTVTARSLAGKLGLPCIEMDEMIEDLEGRRIRDIFASDGEAYFRDTETRLISLLYKRERSLCIV